MAAIPEALRLSLRMAAALFARPQPVTMPMVLLFCLIPVYLVIGAIVSAGPTPHSPQLALVDCNN